MRSRKIGVATEGFVKCRILALDEKSDQSIDHAMDLCVCFRPKADIDRSLRFAGRSRIRW